MSQFICWLSLAAIHATPALALVQPALLTRLYQVQPDSSLFLLMRHRAALFAAVVVACVLAAVHPPSRLLASIVSAISMTSFLVLYSKAGQPPALRTIAVVDLVGLIPLAVVASSALRR